MGYLVDQVDAYKKRGYYGFFDDFESNYVTGDRWTPLTADSSSAATLVLVNKTLPRGILSITQDATDNDEIYFQTTVMPFLIAAGKPMFAEIRLLAAELDTDKQNVCFGFQSAAAAANDLLDDGAGPKASATQAIIYKVDGGTVWNCRSQIGAAVGRTTTVSQHQSAPLSSGLYSTLRVEVNPINSTVAEVIFSIDDGVNGMRQMLDANNIPIKHQLVYTNAVACGVFFGQKTGAASAEVLLVDYACGYQKR
jgi:hypothetical protein